MGSQIRFIYELFFVCYSIFKSTFYKGKDFVFVIVIYLSLAIISLLTDEMFEVITLKRINVLHRIWHKVFDLLWLTFSSNDNSFLTYRELDLWFVEINEGTVIFVHVDLFNFTELLYAKFLDGGLEFLDLTISLVTQT